MRTPTPAASSTTPTTSSSPSGRGPSCCAAPASRTSHCWGTTMRRLSSGAAWWTTASRRGSTTQSRCARPSAGWRVRISTRSSVSCARGHCWPRSASGSAASAATAARYACQRPCAMRSLDWCRRISGNGSSHGIRPCSRR
ncbi:hypothetical protein GBAR_LOCUS20998 [Geodia barretti]|uniref:Uncharacterized protein n=1 Tax=Geodia barretti TaxID=519541 RepID=A0AA35X494_GEOBA|nr:hypothetical protein GBAR_LOCUS20998 [Geodia barretti]